MDYILTIDIGNTRAKYAVFNNDSIIESSVFNPYSNDLALLTQKFPQIKRCIISSVGGKIEECKKQLQNIEIITLSGDISLPFKINYDKKTCVIIITIQEISVGLIVDRVVDAENITTADIEESLRKNSYVSHIINLNGKMKLLVDYDKIIA